MIHFQWKSLFLRPNAPQNLRFTSTSKSVTVNWDAVAGADSYNVYRGADKRLDKNVTGTSYVATGMNPDTKLTVNVTSVNESGESAMSEIATKTEAEGGTE
ncbi:fibronectin type III domain-containing protein [Bacillus safensis]|uniref:fibronectin type III domain-containing protein n=1 Tax=Bacillus TaxID=1386 RepID=UPI00119E1432|nr:MULTISPECIES: fibronectin type III domain-containing protein [Bacillus]MCY7585510.1 fibronectin type III domain-containing protein [Bacillus safensis]MCY7586945.1 fibronectin type III domain-containing protein [Bacillus safensis]